MDTHVIPVTPEIALTRPEGEWVTNVCLTGKGALTCRFLVADEKGFSCQKRGPLSALLTKRAMDGYMTAQADNCEGRLA